MILLVCFRQVHFLLQLDKKLQSVKAFHWNVWSLWVLHWKMEIHWLLILQVEYILKEVHHCSLRLIVLLFGKSSILKKKNLHHHHHQLVPLFCQCIVMQAEVICYQQFITLVKLERVRLWEELPWSRNSLASCCTCFVCANAPNTKPKK